jgi:hypothetical protein
MKTLPVFHETLADNLTAPFFGITSTSVPYKNSLQPDLSQYYLTSRRKQDDKTK